MAPLKLASGCDRRCSFCAIPSFRGSFVCRRPERRARRGAVAGRPRACARSSWSARTPRRTARTSATCGCSRRCCPSWPRSTASSGCGSPTCSPPRPVPGWSRRSRRRRAWRRTSTSPSSTPARAVLRRMRRFGDPERFLGLLEQVRAARREAGVRSNVIVGFPGETEADLRDRCATSWSPPGWTSTGVFGYSDEDGTEAATYDGKLDDDEIRARAEHVTAPGRGAHRAACRGADRRDGRGAGRVGGRRRVEGRAAHQGPEVDGTDRARVRAGVRVGDLVTRRRWSAPRVSTWSHAKEDRR